MYLINKQKKEQRKKGKERCTTNTKKYAERARPCGRAASGRVAWRGALKKYAPKSAGKTCCRVGFQLLPRIKYAPKRGRRPLRGLQNQKERAKKAKKRGLAGQQPRLSRSARFRRPECGGGVCQPGGWLGYAFYAGSITEAAGETCGQPCMHTFCRQNLRKVSG